MSQEKMVLSPYSSKTFLFSVSWPCVHWLILVSGDRVVQSDTTWVGFLKDSWWLVQKMLYRVHVKPRNHVGQPSSQCWSAGRPGPEHLKAFTAVQMGPFARDRSAPGQDRSGPGQDARSGKQGQHSSWKSFLRLCSRSGQSSSLVMRCLWGDADTHTCHYAPGGFSGSHST